MFGVIETVRPRKVNEPSQAVHVRNERKTCGLQNVFKRGVAIAQYSRRAVRTQKDEPRNCPAN